MRTQVGRDRPGADALRPLRASSTLLRSLQYESSRSAAALSAIHECPMRNDQRLQFFIYCPFTMLQGITSGLVYGARRIHIPRYLSPTSASLIPLFFMSILVAFTIYASCTRRKILLPSSKSQHNEIWLKQSTISPFAHVTLSTLSRFITACGVICVASGLRRSVQLLNAAIMIIKNFDSVSLAQGQIVHRQ
jgi:hypothetical protein